MPQQRTKLSTISETKVVDKDGASTSWWIENNQISLPIRTGAKNVSFLVHQHNILIDTVDWGEALGPFWDPFPANGVTVVVLMETQRCITIRCSLMKSSVTMSFYIWSPTALIRCFMNLIPKLCLEYFVPRHWVIFISATHYPKRAEW